MSDIEQQRKEQIEEGRRLAAQDPMILDADCRPGNRPTGRLSMPGKSVPPETISAPSAGFKKPVKKLTGHEAYIEALKSDGTEVKINLMNGTSAGGTIKAADKYTISLLTSSGTTRVIFKHAMVEIIPTKRGVKSND